MTDNISDRLQKQIDSLRGIDWEQYTTKEEETSSLSFFSGILLGLIVGTIVAILLAPQAGSSTREEVIQTGIELLPSSETDGEDVEI